MLATPHMLTGAAIGLLIGSFPAVIVIAFLSHFVLDAIPHTEVSTFQPIEEREDIKPEAMKLAYRIAYFDIIVGVAALLYFYHRNSSLILIVGAFFALLPDILHEVPLWKNFMRYKLFISRQLYSLHSWIHTKMQTKYWPYGIITQVIIVGLALWLLAK